MKKSQTVARYCPSHLYRMELHADAIHCPVCSYEEPLPIDIEALQEHRPMLPGFSNQEEKNG